MVPLVPIKSTMIEAHAFEPVSRTLAIRFNASPFVHLFQNVDPEVAESRHQAESFGKWFGANIRGKFSHTTVMAKDYAGDASTAIPEASDAS